MKKISVLILLIIFGSFQQNFAGSPKSSCLGDHFESGILELAYESGSSQVDHTNYSIFSDESSINCDDLQDDKNKSKKADNSVFSFAIIFQNRETRQVCRSIPNSHKPISKLFILNSVFRL